MSNMLIPKKCTTRRKLLLKYITNYFLKLQFFFMHEFTLYRLNYFESSVAVTVIIISIIDSVKEGAVGNHMRRIDRRMKGRPEVNFCTRTQYGLIFSRVLKGLRSWYLMWWRSKSVFFLIYTTFANTIPLFFIMGVLHPTLSI